MKPLDWLRSSKRDFDDFPDEIKVAMGFALYLAQIGDKHQNAKPLKGLGSGVLEIVESHEANAYRAVYTVRFTKVVYVLDAFQKKSKRGKSTPAKEIELVRQRLKDVELDYKNSYDSE